MQSDQLYKQITDQINQLDALSKKYDDITKQMNILDPRKIEPAPSQRLPDVGDNTEIWDRMARATRVAAGGVDR